MICANQREHEGRNPNDFDGLAGAGDQGSSLIAIAMTKSTQTSLTMADLALMETVEGLVPFLTFHMPCRRLCGV